jgi:nucleotide-binding universal stress UspA family protein
VAAAVNDQTQPLREDEVTTTESVGPIVAGIDGSPPSMAALRWSAAQAVLQSLELHIVVAWAVPNMLGWPVPLPEDFDPSEPAQAVLANAELLLDEDYPGLTVKSHQEEGFAGRCLVDTADSLRASLLVVGARGHGEVTGLLIGSVSEYVATHAKCPVVIIHH